MKIISIIILLPFVFFQSPPLKTMRFSGTYSYGSDIEKERVGFISIYPETDSTILFYLDLNRGAPSYNMGQLYGRAKIKGQTGFYYLNESGYKCNFKMIFSNRQVNITALDDENCPFGYGVYVNGRFKKLNSKVPKYFEDPTGKKIYFSKISPEQFNQF